MKNKKLLTNILFAVVVLAIAAVLLAVRSHNATGGKLTAQLIYGDANAVLDIPLEKDETYSVDTGYYTVHIEVKDGRARFIESPCPDHICEGFGWLSAEDQTATCCCPRRADHRSGGLKKGVFSCWTKTSIPARRTVVPCIVFCTRLSSRTPL